MLHGTTLINGRSRHLSHPVTGMGRAARRRLLGKPRSVQAFPLKQEEVWDWRQPPDVNTEIFFNVHFDQEGRVTHTSKSQEVRG